MSTVTDDTTALQTGTWTIDPVHSEVGFSVRHMMVSKVRGRFGAFTGTITTAEDLTASSVTAEIDMTSIDTNNADRDAHIRSKDFFEVETHPTMTYRSTGVRPEGDGHVLDGELTLKGRTAAVPLRVELNGAGPDAYGGTRVGFTATGELSRRDFGVDIVMPMDGGGVVVGDRIALTLEIEAVLDPGA
jgi:polyisoprenoid-binding protein YceI